MTQQELTDLTKEELKNRLKKQKLLFGIFTGLIIVMLVNSLYSMIKGKNGFSTYMPFGFIPLDVSLGNSYKAVEKELVTRK